MTAMRDNRQHHNTLEMIFRRATGNEISMWASESALQKKQSRRKTRKVNPALKIVVEVWKQIGKHSLEKLSCKLKCIDSTVELTEYHSIVPSF